MNVIALNDIVVKVIIVKVIAANVIDVNIIDTIFIAVHIAKLQIKPKSKSNQTKNLEGHYIWVVVCSLFVVCRNAVI